jgi:hypothetical protein
VLFLGVNLNLAIFAFSAFKEIFTQNIWLIVVQQNHQKFLYPSFLAS